MPAAARDTVISSVAAIEAVAVIVIDEPLFSAKDEAEDVRVIFGTSSSTKLKVKLDVLPAVASAPDKVPSETTIVSAPSAMLSFVGVIVAVPVVSPAAIVMSLMAA